MRKRVFALVLFTAGILCLSLTDAPRENGCGADRTPEELSEFEGEWFVGSGKCVNCHNTSLDGEDQVDAEGNDVSTINDWMGTIMANSARDPFWKAKVSHEGLANPDYVAAIEETCTRCHAPMGHYEMELTTGQAFLMEHLETDELGQDGVGCIGCHAIADVPELGDLNTGEIPYNDDHAAYGGFINPWDGLMSGQTGFSPVYSEHVRESELCASCHGLFTHTFVNGAPTENVFFEQATYHEWVNSAYPDEGTECQTCHMPLVEGGAVAASLPTWLFPQQPYAKHHLVGGNTYMLRLFKEFKDELDLPATQEQLTLVEERTREQLQQQTLDLTLTKIDHVEDTLTFELELWNKAGHKFPSGYPARIAWVHFRLEDVDGNVLFEQGLLDEEFNLIGRDLPYEPHYEVIRNEDQVQVYEMVLGDNDGLATTVLENAAYPLKDNRLVPEGFSTTHYTYDTTLVAGLAIADLNFNAADGIEGSGSDRVTYRIALDGYEGEVVAQANVFYQSVPPRWLEEMFTYDSAPINTFKDMYAAVDPEPELIASVTLDTTTSVDEIPEDFALQIGPNPANGWVRVQCSEEIKQIRTYTSDGKLLLDQPWLVRSGWLELPDITGVVLVEVRTDYGVRLKRILVR